VDGVEGVGALPEPEPTVMASFMPPLQWLPMPQM
jgi:hypothetical protein